MCVNILEVNNSDVDLDKPIRVIADRNGEFQINLNPGDYSIGLYDTRILKDKMHSPLFVRIAKGEFKSIVMDYDQLKVRDLPKAK